MDLDSIQKKENRRIDKPVQKEEIEPKKNKSENPRRRLVDNFKILKTHKIRVPSNGSRNLRKIRIFKPNLLVKRRKLLRFLGLALLVFISLSFLIISSRGYKMFRLLSGIKNESIILGFQNSAELRPTGGYWGSFALLNVKNNLSQSEILFETNPYKNDNPLLKNSTVELPKPMKQTWPNRPQSFVNANWALDFGEASKTLEYYFGQGWNQPTDGVIGVSSLAMIDLLRLTGPITASDGTLISADNFTQIMSQKIDTEYWQTDENKVTNEPKTIIKEIAPQIVSKAKKLPKLKLYKFALDQMRKGRIIAYFNDEKKQSIVEDLEISGKLLPYSKDYLQINNANLNGGKSSLNIDQKIKYSVSKDSTGVIANLKVTRTYADHSWPDILNRNYTRVVTPLGSQLILAKLNDSNISNDVETLDESGRTTFGFWFSVAPAESQTIELEYRLPFLLNNLSDYNLIIQKQPGTITDKIEINVLEKVLFDNSFDRNFLKISRSIFTNPVG